MLKLALITMFAMSLGTLTIVASYLPTDLELRPAAAIVVADAGRP